jgi:hypothetical protein
MHEKVLPERSKALLAWLETSATASFQDWTLAGGTGLALWFGHRISDDFDFFRNQGLDLSLLHGMFKNYGKYETLQEAENTLTVLVEETKISFFVIPDPFLFKRTPYRFFLLADIRDIALMKLIAISGRGSRKDFIDLYTILRNGPILKDFFPLLPIKYGAGRANVYHILKSLTYFKDAEREPPPTMLEPFDWEECKAFFSREAHTIVLPA